MADERARWEQVEVAAVLAIMTERKIETLLDIPGLKKTSIYMEVEQALKQRVPGSVKT